ncbi:MAG: hypothetical protein O3C27_06525 [Actinomycetota bacterium]|nr:hypothetical protein [Actinomycetota bacterium]
MRSLVGAAGDGDGDGDGTDQPSRDADRGSIEADAPTLDDLTKSGTSDPPPPRAGSDGATKRSSRLPSVAPDPTPGEARSRFDADERIVFYNESHADYLMVKGSETELLDYLATLVAKEYAVYNHPIVAPPVLAEEMVRMLIRVRRHLARRR